MTKKLKIVALATGILFLAGCGNKVVNQNENKEETKKQEKKQEKNEGGIISSIKDAISSGREMKCTYKIKSGESEMEMVTYVKGKKYMGETKIAGETQKMIFDENAIYSWSAKTKKGMKMTTACTEELAKNAPREENDLPEAMDFSAEDKFENAMDVKCEPTSGADFSVPTDVEFQDQCEMMKNLMQSMQGLQNGAGAQSGAGAQGGAGMPNLIP